MIDSKEINTWIRRAGFTLEGLASTIKMESSVLEMKINNVVGETLTINEVIKIAEVLDIPRDKLEDIFFARNIAEMQN